MATSRSRSPLTLLLAGSMLLPIFLGALPTGFAQGAADDVRVVAVYDAFEGVPDDAYFAQRGLVATYRFAAIPGVVVTGPASAVEDLRADPRFDHLTYDGEIAYAMSSAVVSTRARDIWGSAWHDGAGTPLTKDGVVLDGTGVTVGIVDSGVNALHPDIGYKPLDTGELPYPAKVKACVHTTSLIQQGGENIVVETPNCDENVGHGTHVAGIVAGTGLAADSGLAPLSDCQECNGVAPGADLVVAGLGVETVALGGLVIDGLAGLDFMYANRDLYDISVVTNSWSSSADCSAGIGYVDDHWAISNKLVSEGITVLWAASNYGAAATWTGPQSRNPMPGVISVANYDDKGTGTRDGDVNGGSSDGCAGEAPNKVWTWPDVAAPGTNIVSVANGIDAALLWTPVFVGADPTDAPFYTTLTGTSMATPHVAGVVALMYQAYPDITPAQVERILIETATPWKDGVGARGIGGTTPMWGPDTINNANAGFTDASKCLITPQVAARAEANDPTLDAQFPEFRALVQPRPVQGVPGATMDIDASLYVCRDFKRGHGLVDAEAAVKEALRLAGEDDDPQGVPEVTITSPTAGATLPPASVTVSGLVDREATPGGSAPDATVAADVTAGPAPLDVTFTLGASDADGDALAGWTLDFGDGTMPAGAPSGGPVATVEHTYAQDGAYTATLTVTDATGAAGEATVDVVVGSLDGVRIGTDDTGDVPTSGACTGSTAPCQYEWLASASDGFDLEAVFVQDDAANIRFTFDVADPDAFFVEPSGDPASATDPSRIVRYGLNVNFETSPVTSYSVSVERARGSSTITGTLGKVIGVLTANAALPSAGYDEESGLFYVDVPKSQFPELAAASTLTGLDASSSFNQRGSGNVALTHVMDGGLTTVENGEYAMRFPTSPAAFGRAPYAARAAPSSAPADAQIQDAAGDTPAAQADVLAAWFENDDEYLYVGLEINDIPADPTTAAQVVYTVGFKPDSTWKPSVVPATGATFTGLRVTGEYRVASLGQPAGTAPGLKFELQALWTEVSGSKFGKVVDLPLATMDVDSDILWFPVPRSVIGDPPAFSTLSALSAGTAANLVAGTLNGVDSATSGESYVFTSTTMPLAAVAGGPYAGPAGAPIAIHGDATGGSGTFTCAWSASAPTASFADAGACDTTVTFADAGAYSLTLTVTDDTGSAQDNAGVTVEAPTGERVELFVGTETTPRATIPLSTGPEATAAPWSAAISLAGLAGTQTLTATWLDADGATVLDTATVDFVVTVEGAPFVRIDNPSSGAIVSGNLVVAGVAGHGDEGAAPQTLRAFGPDGLLERDGQSVQTGAIAVACGACQGSELTEADPSFSLAWGGAGSPADGVDGVWIAIEGFAGAQYELSGGKGAMDVWFYATDADVDALDSDVSGEAVKTGDVPAGANWAFVTMRQPTADNAADGAGVNDVATLTLRALPGAPTNLVALGLEGAVRLTWLAPSEDGGNAITGYRIERDGAFLADVGPVTTWDDSGLGAATTHEYVVRATTVVGTGPASNTATATTSAPDTAAPSQVVGATLGAVTSSSVSFSWSAATDNVGVDHYAVTRDGTPVGTTDALAYTLTGLLPETTYAFTVRAVDAAGNVGPASAPLQATTAADETAETVTLFVDGVAGPATIVDTTGGDAEWSVVLDTLTLTNGGHELRAVFTDAQEATADASVLVEVANGVAAPFVRVTTPATDGATLTTPFTFEGAYSTDGSEPQHGESPAVAVTDELRAYANDPFVAATLRSPAYAALLDDLHALDGFVGALPLPAGEILVVLRGDAPEGAPATGLGVPLRYVEGAQPQTLTRPVTDLPKNRMSLDEFEAWVQSADGKGAADYGIEQGMGPGSALLQGFNGQAPGFICTASFLFQNPATGKYYLGTAGHCVLDESVDNSWTAPASKVADTIEVCVSGCLYNFVGATLTTVQLKRTATYDPVAFAVQSEGGRDVNHDFALIELPASVAEYVRPWMFLWGGPTGVATGDAFPQPGDPLAHYGHGYQMGATLATQGRLHMNLDSHEDEEGNFFDGSGGLFMLGYISGGDSGSAIATATPRAAQLMMGDRALGTLTHGYGIGDPLFGLGPSLGLFEGTSFERGLDMAEARLGWRPVLVTEDASVDFQAEAPVQLTSTITQPALGATLDKVATPEFGIRGAATFPAAPGTGSAGKATYYLHRTSCGVETPTDIPDVLTMSLVKSPAAEPGDGCGSRAHPVGPAWEAAIGELAEAFPADPAPASALYPDLATPVRVDLGIRGWNGLPIALADYEARLTMDGGATVLAAARADQTAVADGRLVMELPWSDGVTSIPPGADLTFTFVTHQSAGPSHYSYGGDGASFIEVPLANPPAKLVEVSIDDPTFTTGTLLVTGRESWVATWPLQGVAVGEHTIYVRASQDGETQTTPTTRVVTITSDVVDVPPTAAFTQQANGLLALFADASTPGSAPIASRAWDFGDGATSAATSPAHTYAAAGTYTVTLTVTDENGQSDSDSQDVAVTDDATGPVWDVQVRVVGPTSVDWQTVALPADGDAGAWSYAWSPADALGGAYTLEARLRSDGNVRDLAQRAFVLEALNAAPTVTVDTVAPADERATVALSASAQDGDGDELTYAWTQVSGPAVALAGANGLSASFVAPDLEGDQTYRFRFTASDGERSASDTVDVLVRDVHHLAALAIDGVDLETALLSPLTGIVDVAGLASAARSAGANAPPVARITDAAVAGLRLTASGATSTDTDGDIVAFSWDLGNGEQRSGAALDYTYSAAGTYTVTLSVTDDAAAVGQTQMEVTVDEVQPPTFAVDAGDSVAVRAGDVVALGALAFAAPGPVTYTWSDGTTVKPGQAVEFDTTGYAPGPHAFTVTAQAGDELAADTVVVEVYELTTQRVLDEGADVVVGVNDEDAGEAGTVDGSTYTYGLVVPATATKLDVVLDWTSHPVQTNDTEVGGGGVNDFDLAVFSPGGGQDATSGFDYPERVSVVAPIPGAWQVQVNAYLVVNDRFTVTADLTSAPASAIPVATDTTQACFETPTQTLTGAVSPGATGKWDLDNDGAFDDATGESATTSHAVGSGAHLARFRAESASGLRDTVTVAYRVETDCLAAPSVVVVGISDSGVNPYHKDFAGELVPYPELVAYTTADPDNLGPGDVVVRHKLTDEVLPFTKHPSSYIPGFPANAEAIELTLGGGFYKSLDDQRGVWASDHSYIAFGQWYWIPGTKIVAAIDGSDTAAVNDFAGDQAPILDEGGHGTASASTAVGNMWGSCKRCLLAFAEGLSSDVHFFDKPWIDFVSVSGGSPANVGVPDGGQFDFEAATRAAAERGQTISYAAGNGADLMFLTPEQTYLSNGLGPDWTLDVGAVTRDQNGVVLGTGKPVDWSSYGSGNIPASCTNNYQGNCGHSGTSAATPISTGHLANLLLDARIALGDPLAGQKTPAQANGVRQAVAVGAPVAGSTWLSDGVLTRAELWNVALHCASDFGTQTGFAGFVYLPQSEVDYAYGGYGVSDDAAEACARNALLAGGAVPQDAAADTFYELDEAIRDALWGDWDGDGDGAPGGNFNGATSLRLPVGPLAREDVDTLGEAGELLAKLAESLGARSLAGPAQETYFLHHLGGCVDGAVPGAFMDLTNTAGDDDGCGGAGTGPVLGTTPFESFTSTVPTAGFAAGATVTGTIYMSSYAPGPVTVTAKLLADGVEIGAGAPASMPIVPTTYGAFAVSMVTTAAAPAGATLTLDVYVAGTPTAFFGYEGARASAFTVSGETGENGDPDANEAVIVEPAQGAELSGATATVSGTATFEAATTGTRAYLRWDGSGSTCGDRSLSLVDGPDGGQGCRNNGAPASAVLPVVYDYPYLDAPLGLVPGARVGGILYMTGDTPSSGRMMLMLKDGETVLGSQLVSFEHTGVVGDVIEVPVDFPLEGLSTTAPLQALSFELHVESGVYDWPSLDDPASYLELPVAAEATGRSVQVSIDDPTFATNALAVQGTTTWSATWDLDGVAPGPHTIYARAGVDGDYGAATSVGVLVTQNATSTVAVQVQVVPAGVMSSDGWTDAAYDGEARSWSYLWDTAPLANSAHDFHVRLVQDGTVVRTATFTADTVNPHAPVLAVIDAQSTLENETLGFVADASDLDGDALAYSLEAAPSGATIDAETGAFSWTPSFLDAGAHTAVVRVEDGTGLNDTQTVEILVENVNRPPTLAPLAAASVDEAATLSLQLAGDDPDSDDALAYSANALPAGAALDGATGAFTWTPGYDQAGEHVVSFTVSDGESTATQDATITVVNVNRAPTVAPLGARSLVEGETLSVRVVATDDDGDAFVLSVSPRPDGATLTPADDGSATFTWTPTQEQAGEHALVFTATDSLGASGSETLAVDVNDLTHAPVLEPVENAVVFEGDLVTFPVRATDADGDAITIGVLNPPPGATLTPTGPGAADFSWRPTFDQEGRYLVVLTASDGEQTAREDVTLVVSEGDGAPVLVPVAPRALRETETVRFFVNAHDPDGDAVALAMANLPEGARFDAAKRVFSWTPTLDQEGEYLVTMRASDGTHTTSEDVSITVARTNRAPHLTGADVAAVLANRALVATLPVADADGDALTYAVSGVPEGATFADGTLTWATTLEDAGTYVVSFAATDGEGSASGDLTIVVQENAAPTVALELPAPVDAGVLATLFANVTDPDGGNVTVTWAIDVDEDTTLPLDGARVNATFLALGARNVSVRAVDDDGMETVVNGTVLVDDRIVLELAILEAAPDMGTGTRASAKLAWWNGTAIGGHELDMAAFWRQPVTNGAQTTAEFVVVTDGNGTAEFFIPRDTPLTNLAGEHLLLGKTRVASSFLGDVESAYVTVKYVVG